MKCKSCNKKIPEGSNFCNWCGVRQGKLPKAEGDIKIPTPTKLKSGKWHIYLRAEGVSITESSEAKCIAKAKAYRAGYIEEKIKRGDALPLGEAMDKYLADNSNILSPSTLRGYSIIRRNRFQDYMEQDIKTFTDWQAMINEETTLCSPKTLHNAWGFVGAVLRANDITPPRLKEPRQRLQELPWLTYEQIPLFLDAIHGDTCELGALLALSSLRRILLSKNNTFFFDGISESTSGKTVSVARKSAEKPLYTNNFISSLRSLYVYFLGGDRMLTEAGSSRSRSASG
jgi:hypothetical protein